MDEVFLFPTASPKGRYYYIRPKPTKLEAFYSGLQRLFCCMSKTSRIDHSSTILGSTRTRL